MTNAENPSKAAASGSSKKLGLTTAQAEKLYEEVGFNELPHIEVSLWWMFFSQFTGVMPYTLEIACILALAVQSYPDFAIIAAILLCNGVLGFTEELNAKKSLVSDCTHTLFNIVCLSNYFSLSLSNNRTLSLRRWSRRFPASATARRRSC